jgi:hypothetical protein
MRVTFVRFDRQNEPSPYHDGSSYLLACVGTTENPDVSLKNGMALAIPLRF